MSEDRFGPHALKLSGAMMRLFGWMPDTFWTTTPAELAALLAPDPAASPPAPLGRADLSRLMEMDNDQRSD